MVWSVDSAVSVMALLLVGRLRRRDASILRPTSASAAPSAGVSVTSGDPRVELLEQQRLGEDRVAERLEVQRLVRAVRARVRVLDARDQDLRAGELADEVGDERDRTADADVDGLDAVALVQRLARGPRPPSRWCRRGRGRRSPDR